MVGTPDVIAPENFGDDRIKDLRAAGGQILPFPTDFDRRPYNTLALPCECVIYIIFITNGSRKSEKQGGTTCTTENATVRGDSFQRTWIKCGVFEKRTKRLCSGNLFIAKS